MIWLLLLQWSHLEQRTPAMEQVLGAFRAQWETAHTSITPGVGAYLYFTEAELLVDGERAIAYTRWDEDAHTFETRADWRMLVGLSKDMRAHIAIHEACHLLDGERLKDPTPISTELRHMLEMHAERCVVVWSSSE